MKIKQISFCLYFLCLFVGRTWAQSTTLDSLDVLLAASGNDVERKGELLSIAADKAIDIDPLRGEQYAQQLIQLGGMLSEESFLGKGFYFKGMNLIFQGDNDSAGVACYRASIPHLRKAELWTELGKTYYNIGFAERNQFKYWNAIAYLELSLNAFGIINEQDRIVRVKHDLAYCFTKAELYDSAMQIYFELLEKYSDMLTPQLRNKVHEGIAESYYKTSNFESSNEYYNKAIEGFSNLSDTTDWARAEMMLGNVHSDWNRNEEALIHYKKSRDLYISAGMLNDVLFVDFNEGVVRSEWGEYTYPVRTGNALMQRLLAIRSYKELSQTYFELAKIYRTRQDSARIIDGLSESQCISLAEENYVKAVNYGKMASAPVELSSIYLGFAELKEQQGDYSNALRYFKLGTALRDSVFSVDKQNDLLKQEYGFKMRRQEDTFREENDRNMEKASAEIRKQQFIRNGVALGALAFLVFAAIGYNLYKRRRDAEKGRLESEMRLVVAETEMKALRAQMNPHFIFNSLNSVAAFIGSNDLKQADKYLTKFARLMRMVLENSMHKTVSLSEDISVLKVYVELEILRLNKPVSFEVTIADNIDSDEVQIPPLILQPFVENAIWHGIAKVPYPAELKIEIKTDGESLIAIVEDNGIGMVRESTSESHVSRGTEITRNRIRLAGSELDSTQVLEFVALNPGTRVMIRLPLETRF